MSTLNLFCQSIDDTREYIPGAAYALDLPTARRLVNRFFDLWQTTERRAAEMVNAGKSTRDQVLLLGEQNDSLRAKLAEARDEVYALRLRVAELAGDTETIAEYAARSAARESAAIYGTRISGGAGRLGS